MAWRETGERMTRHAIVIIALTIGTWLLFDGLRAVLTGAYTTPRSGIYAGQLGPWSHLLLAIGADPFSWPVRIAHLLLGFAWLSPGIAFWLLPTKAWWPLLLTCVASLWYAPFGTLAAVAVGLMLLLPANRLAT